MIIKKILNHNWIAIIFFNFKMLPFEQAIHLPFDFYNSVRFNSLKGHIKINCDKIYRGMIKIGSRGSDIFPRLSSVITIDGNLEIGENTELGNGISLVIKKNANLVLHNRVRIGAFSKIYCSDKIEIFSEVDLSWNCQVFDTNFHQIQNIENGMIYPINSPIKIGTHCWIGNNVTIMKGTVLPDYTIVASNSLCNKDYSKIPLYSVLAGCPVKAKKTGYRRIFE